MPSISVPLYSVSIGAIGGEEKGSLEFPRGEAFSRKKKKGNQQWTVLSSDQPL